MKKIMAISVLIGSMLSLSSDVFAISVPPVIGLNLCVQPIDWKKTKKWHFNAIVHCHHIRCTLIDESGGVPDPDPKKNTFWENIDWTFSKNGVTLATSQCKAYPLDPTCDFNTPAHTCTALYLLHHEPRTLE